MPGHIGTKSFSMAVICFGVHVRHCRNIKRTIYVRLKTETTISIQTLIKTKQLTAALQSFSTNAGHGEDGIYPNCSSTLNALVSSADH